MYNAGLPYTQHLTNLDCVGPEEVSGLGALDEVFLRDDVAATRHATDHLRMMDKMNAE